MTQPHRHFASDNNAGFYPEVLAELERINSGHVTGYGDDSYTNRARTLISELFDRECAVFFVSNGTSANCLALATLLKPYQSVIAHEHSHLETDECNAIGLFAAGVKVHTVTGPLAKIRPESLKEVVTAQRPVHSSKPGAVTITNATELGTVYQIAEVAAIAEEAHALGLAVHMDGARFANAVASLDRSPAELTWKAGVDVLSFGGTKNGLAFGESIVFFDPSGASEFEWRMKQAGQLASKMRFLAGQWPALLADSLWLRRAAHANAMAKRLRQRLETIPSVSLLFPTEANAVFAKIPEEAIRRVHDLGWHFYTDVGPGGGARLMCSWDTTEEDVDRFCHDLGL